MAREVIDGGRHSLVEDITKVFSMETKYGPEAIWSFNANGEARSTDPHIWSSLEGWGDYSCDKDWAELVFPDQPRREAYLELTNRDGVGYLELGQGIGIKKFMYDTWENFDNGITTISIPIIRYADVLLIFAEADNMANGGPTPAALEAVNSVIDRANGYEPNPAYPLLTAAMSRDEFDRAVVAERGFELCFEYDRWCDIVRKRILGEVTNEDYMPNYTDADYLYPIPEVETRLNDNMEQNPGYSS
jgi:hypothetical protein